MLAGCTGQCLCLHEMRTNVYLGDETSDQKNYSQMVEENKNYWY